MSPFEHLPTVPKIMSLVSASAPSAYVVLYMETDTVQIRRITSDPLATLEHWNHFSSEGTDLQVAPHNEAFTQ